MNYKKIIGVILTLPLIISVGISFTAYSVVLVVNACKLIPTINPLFFYACGMFILFLTGLVLYNWDDKHKGGSYD